MELIAVALVVSAAYVYAPVLRVHAARRLRIPLPAGAAAQGAEPVTPAPVALPDQLQAFINQESEQWAREELTDRARGLYHEYDGDWDRVFADLERI